MRIGLSLLFVAGLGACTGELHELQPPDLSDGGGAGGDLGGPAGDLGGAKDGPGSPDLAMAKTTFDPSVQNDLDTMGCSQNACHGSGIINLNLVEKPASMADVDANYAEVKQRASSGAMSLLLLKNLKGSGQSHGGGMPFATTMDPTYQRWLAWINDGAPR
jgi:hypothetical protein